MVFLGSRAIVVALMFLTLSSAVPLQSTNVLITFQVRGVTTAQAIQGATISLVGSQTLTQDTNANGMVTLSIPYGKYTITVSELSCTQIGPESFIVDQSAPSSILVKLQCSSNGSPPLETPSLQTDKTQYHQRETVNWRSSGFAPGAYVQPCLAEVCGAVLQSDGSGNANGFFAIDVASGVQSFSVKNINTGTSAQISITISG